MERLWKALLNSFRAFRRLTATEKAVQQEMVLLIVAIPSAWFIARTWDTYFLLVLSVVFLIVVEVLNTAIEATCNAITRTFNKDIQLAKDAGSLAVLLTIIIVASIWIVTIHDRFFAGAT